MSSVSATGFLPFTFPFIRLWMKVLLLLLSVPGVFNIYHTLLLFIGSTESSKHIFLSTLEFSFLKVKLT